MAKRFARNVKTALAVVPHDDGEPGIGSLRTVGFDNDGTVRVTYIELTLQEAEDLRAALSDLVGGHLHG